MECAPVVSDDVLNVAEPLESVPVPITETPSLNVTVPVGVPEPGEITATVAVKVTLWPIAEGFTDEPSATETLPMLTTWLSVEDVLAEKELSPE
jgi:hypothetical protein